MKYRIVGLLAMSLLLGLAGCEKKGPAEQAGEKVDEAAAEVKEGAQDAGDAVCLFGGDLQKLGVRVVRRGLVGQQVQRVLDSFERIVDLVGDRRRQASSCRQLL